MAFTRSFSEIDSGSTTKYKARSSVQIEVRIATDDGTPLIIGRLQNLRISEDYAQQLVKEVGSRTGVEFVPGIATGNGNCSMILLEGRTWKEIAAEASGKTIDSVKLHDLPQLQLAVTDRKDGACLFTLVGVAFMNASKSIQQGNNTIAQDVSFGFIDVAEGEATDRVTN